MNTTTAVGKPEAAKAGGEDSQREAVASCLSLIKRLFDSKSDPNASLNAAILSAFQKFVKTDPRYIVPSENVVDEFCKVLASQSRSIMDHLLSVRLIKHHSLPEPILRLYWDIDTDPSEIHKIGNGLVKNKTMANSCKTFCKKTSDVNLDTLLEIGFSK